MSQTCLNHILILLYRSIFIKNQYRPKGGRTIKLITLYLPEPYIKALDRLVNEKYYPNRAEAIRVAIHDLIDTEVWRRQSFG